MKKALAALMIATLILGTFLSMAAASATSIVLSTNDDDEHEEFNGEEGTGEQEAAEAIREAEEQIQKASDKIEEANAKGLDVTDAENLLAQANDKLSQAQTTYEKGKYEEAEDLAEEAIHLAEMAKHLAEEALGKAGEEEDEEEEGEETETEAEEEEEPEMEEKEEEEGVEEVEEAAEDAMEAIREAEEQIKEAESKINQAKEKGLDVAEIEGILNEAKKTLSDAKKAFDGHNYEEAERLAEQAEELAEKAKHLIEELLEKSEETEHAKEEEDEEEEEELEAEEDEEGDLVVTSPDNQIEFIKDEPKIEFEYAANGTEIKFEAKDFALIEFVDRNSDGKIQEEEIEQWLKFDEIKWDVISEKTVEGDTTIITVTYFANTTKYEITIIMHVYQKSVTGSSSTREATVVFDVDGGADEVKFDLIVSRWTWDPEADESSQLALFMNVEAEVEGEVALESAGVDKDQITVKLDDIGIKVSWVKKAEVDGDFVDIAVTYKSMELELEGGEVGLELEVYFMYPYFGANKLIHDPSIGIEDDPVIYVFTLITPELLIGTGITAVAIVAAAIALTQRKKLPLLESVAPPF